VQVQKVLQDQNPQAWLHKDVLEALEEETRLRDEELEEAETRAKVLSDALAAAESRAAEEANARRQAEKDWRQLAAESEKAAMSSAKFDAEWQKRFDLQQISVVSELDDAVQVGRSQAIHEACDKFEAVVVEKQAAWTANQLELNRMLDLERKTVRSLRQRLEQIEVENAKLLDVDSRTRESEGRRATEADTALAMAMDTELTQNELRESAEQESTILKAELKQLVSEHEKLRTQSTKTLDAHDLHWREQHEQAVRAMQQSHVEKAVIGGQLEALEATVTNHLQDTETKVAAQLEELVQAETMLTVRDEEINRHRALVAEMKVQVSR
jgi:hypothetical protein